MPGPATLRDLFNVYRRVPRLRRDRRCTAWWEAFRPEPMREPLGADDRQLTGELSAMKAQQHEFLPAWALAAAGRA